MENLGEEMCRDLRWHCIKADWYIDPLGELLLILNDCELIKCVGERLFNGELLPFWTRIKPTCKSLQNRHITGKTCLEYVEY